MHASRSPFSSRVVYHACGSYQLLIWSPHERRDLIVLADADVEEAIEHIADECALNPVHHLLHTSLPVPECRPEEVALPPNDDELLPDASYLLSLPPQVEHARVTKQFLERQGFPNVKVWPGVNGSSLYNIEDYSFKLMWDSKTGGQKMVASAWYDAARKVLTHPYKNDGFVTRGERGYRASMLSIFLDAMARDDVNTILIMDYDVVFHCDFKRKLVDLLRCPRCGHHVAKAAKHGGVLMLGATIWLDDPDEPLDDSLEVPFGGWPSVEHDMAERRLEDAAQPLKCFNVQLCTLGSFAVIYHRHAFPFVIDFLTQPLQKPFDHIYPFLTSSDLIVRAAYPFLTAADVSHASSVDASRSKDVFLRLQRHRWDAESFCQPGTDEKFFKAVRSPAG